MNCIKVLVVDDSAFMLKYISELLEEDPEIKVVGTAINGLQALDKLEEMEPDVITLDIEMPIMDGLKALEVIMRKKPTPVVMLSNHTQIGADTSIKALEMGAVDFVPKPSGNISLDLNRISKELTAKVKVAAMAKKVVIPDALMKRAVTELCCSESESGQNHSTQLKWLIAIGASTGGPKALQSILTRLEPAVPAAVIIAQHMPAGFTKSLAKRFNEICALPVHEAEEGQLIEAGKVYISPGNYNLEVREKPTGYYISLNQNKQGNPNCPCVDQLMFSVAQCGIPKIGVILTGMGKDGSEGLKRIKESGGITVAEHESSCIIYGMPRAAIETGFVDLIEPLHGIAKILKDLAN